MSSKPIILVFIISLLCLSENGMTQDSHFSQFYLSKTYLNPASTGSEQGLSVFVNYRNQWNKIKEGFQTASFAVDMQSPGLSSGIGIQGYYDVAGGALRTNSIGFTYAYIIRITKSFNIHIGLGADYVNKSLDIEQLIFSDQLDAFDGILDGGTAADLVRDRVSYFDINAGTLLRFSMKIGRSEIHNSLGFAVHHLTSPVESFLDQESRVPKRYAVHFGSMIPIGQSIMRKKSMFYFSPVFKYETQSKVDVYTVGFFNLFKPLYVGAFYQANGFGDNSGTQTLIMTGGVNSNLSKHINFTLGYSYDLNLGGVTNVSGGVHEIALKFNFEKAEIFTRERKPGKYKPVRCYQFKGKGSIRLF